MSILSFLSSLQAPHDLWTILLEWLEGGIGNIDWALLILTLMVKVATSPLDFMVKLSTKKQTLVQQKCSPEVAKLQKKFGNDRQRLQLQTQALYKREGLKMGSGCLIMLVNMILTMVIFFSFFGTLRDVSAYSTINQYEQVVDAASDGFNQEIIDFKENDEIATTEDIEEWILKYTESQEYLENPDNIANATTDEYKKHEKFIEDSQPIIDAANEGFKKAAIEKWSTVKSKWLWVQNIWVADATTRPFPTYDNLLEIVKKADKSYVEYIENNISKADYSKVSSILYSQDVKYNGFYILAILAGAITFLAQYIAELHNKLKNKKANALAKAAKAQNSTSIKMMKIIMPIIMVFFVLSSSASFGIYILASNVATIAVGEIITLFVDRATRKKQQEVEEVLEKEANRLIKKGKL